MNKYTRKIYKKIGSGLTGMTSRKSMSNLQSSPSSPKSSPKSLPKSSPKSLPKSLPKPNTNKRPILTLNLDAANEAKKEINDEKKKAVEFAEYKKEKFSKLDEKTQNQKEKGKYLPIKRGSIRIDQTPSAAQEVDALWEDQRAYSKASKMGITSSPFKSPKNNNKNPTIFGFPTIGSPIQGSPLPVLLSPSPSSSHSSKKPRTSIFKTPYPLDLFPISPTKPGTGGNQPRKKTYKSKKSKKSTRSNKRYSKTTKKMKRRKH
jgi:hypothetical protein